VETFKKSMSTDGCNIHSVEIVPNTVAATKSKFYWQISQQPKTNNTLNPRNAPFCHTNTNLWIISSDFEN